MTLICAFQVVKDHIILDKISGYLTNWEEIVTLGLALHSDPHDVRRLRNQSHSVKAAAYDVMSAFYDRSSDVTEMWETLIQALQELGLNKAVVDLGLDRFMTETRAKTGINKTKGYVLFKQKNGKLIFFFCGLGEKCLSFKKQFQRCLSQYIKSFKSLFFQTLTWFFFQKCPGKRLHSNPWNRRCERLK